MKSSAEQAASQFAMAGKPEIVEPYGSGHIHDTYLVATRDSGRTSRYILQRINHAIFTDPPAVMANILRVTEHLASGSRNAPGATLCLVPTQAGKSFLQDQAGNYWRVYAFVPHSRSYDVISSPNIVRGAARAYGEFQSKLVGLPGPRLVETIPDFHNTPKRLRAFESALATDAVGRAAAVPDEIQFAKDRSREAGMVMERMAQGRVPERIVHNDTKFNNVLFHEKTEEPICVIDLDTVMPGSVLFDFGDMVRTATSPTEEDERDLSLVRMEPALFEALVNGYLEGAAGFLTQDEVELLPFSGKLITYENGLRFLTDYLAGDTYFKTHREHHNLDRCRTQFRLVESIESQFDQMASYVQKRWAETVGL